MTHKTKEHPATLQKRLETEREQKAFLAILADAALDHIFDTKDENLPRPGKKVDR